MESAIPGSGMAFLQIQHPFSTSPNRFPFFFPIHQNIYMKGNNLNEEGKYGTV